MSGGDNSADVKMVILCLSLVGSPLGTSFLFQVGPDSQRPRGLCSPALAISAGVSIETLNAARVTSRSPAGNSLPADAGVPPSSTSRTARTRTNRSRKAPFRAGPRCSAPPAAQRGPQHRSNGPKITLPVQLTQGAFAPLVGSRHSCVSRGTAAGTPV